MGNADMGALVFGVPHKLRFRLGKMDLWDSRWNDEDYNPPLPLSRLKEFIFEKSRNLKRFENVSFETAIWRNRGKVYPGMRMGADLMIRMCLSGSYPCHMQQCLHMADGTHEVIYSAYQTMTNPEFKVRCRSFISWQDNVLALKFDIYRKCVRRGVVSLSRPPWGGRSWEAQSFAHGIEDVDKNSHIWNPSAGALPASEIKVKGNTASLWQVFPGDGSCPERGFSIVVSRGEEGGEFSTEPSGQAISVLDREEVTLFAAMASEMEGPDSMGRARELSQNAVENGWEALYEEHANAWKEYWMKSAVELEDKAIERHLVHSSYSLAISTRSGRPNPGLYGAFVPNDLPAWRGDIHNNNPEMARLFWSSFPLNHEEQALNYTEFIHTFLPMAKRIAEEIFECEECIAFSHTYFGGTENYSFHNLWARSLFLTAQHVQNLWWHYQYFGDKNYLRTNAYPVMKKCARFYIEMLKKNKAGDYTLWPTVTNEINGFVKDFELNKNNLQDLAYVRFLMRAMLEASRELGKDSNDRRLWKEILDNLAPYPTIMVNGKEEFVDHAAQPRRPDYNYCVPLVPFWPGEDPDVYNDPHLRDIGINSFRAGGWKEYPLIVACIRLGMKGKAYEELKRFIKKRRKWSEVLFPCNRADSAYLICEMLITAWDGVIRLFPGWPLKKKAQFHNIRTKGAFLVNASCGSGKIGKVRVLSEKGNPLRMVKPWSSVRVLDEKTGREVQARENERRLEWPTCAHQSFLVEEV